MGEGKQRIGKKHENAKVTVACASCRLRKKKCDGRRPCSRCVISSVECRYGGSQDNCALFSIAENESKSLANIENSLIDLSEASSLDSELLKAKISQMNCLLQDVSMLLTDRFDSSQYDVHNKGSSVETLLIQKKSFVPNGFSRFQNRDTNQPLLNKFFGLYTPLLTFSSLGLSWIFRTVLSCSDSRAVKDSLFLILKFLDGNATLSKEGKETSNMTPLESYAYFRNLPLNGTAIQEKLQNQFQVNSYSFLGGGNPRKDLEELTKRLRDHISSLQNLETRNISLDEFLEKDYLISSLCHQLYRRECYSRISDMEPIQSFISIVELRYYMDDILLIGNIITLSCRKAIEIGLNRWEYYIGEDETRAEKMRVLWLQCYWWDKWQALVTGKEPLIATQLCSCLPPRDLLELGLSYGMSSSSLIDTLNTRSILDETTFRICHLILSRIIEDVFLGLLYHKDFTSYEYFLSKKKGFSSKEKAVLLFEKTAKVRYLLSSLGSKFKELSQETIEDEKTLEFSFHMSLVTISLYQYLENLIVRVRSFFGLGSNLELKAELAAFQEHRLILFHEALSTLVRSPTQYNVLKHVWYVLLIVFNTVNSLLEQTLNVPVYEISLMLSTCNVFMKSMNDPDTSSFDPPFKTTLKRYTKMMLILTRIISEFHVHRDDTSEDQLRVEISDIDSNLLNVFDSIMSNRNPWYKDFLSNERVSDFRNTVLKLIGMEMSNFEHAAEENVDELYLEPTEFLKDLFDDEFVYSFLNDLENGQV